MAFHLFQTVAHFGSGRTLERCEFCETLRSSRPGNLPRYTRRLSRGDYVTSDFELPCQRARTVLAPIPFATVTLEPDAEVLQHEAIERYAVQVELTRQDGARL